MDEIRCGNCRRKLAEGIYIALSIKCPRCGAVNQLRAERPPPARHRVPDPKGHSIGNPSKENAGSAPAR